MKVHQKEMVVFNVNVKIAVQNNYPNLNNESKRYVIFNMKVKIAQQNDCTNLNSERELMAPGRLHTYDSGF